MGWTNNDPGIEPRGRRTAMERYLGIDIHRDSSTICALSAAGRQTHRNVVEANGRTLVSYLKGLRGKLHVCIEETSWSEWLYEVLSPLCAELVVYQNEWTPGAKSDAIDAATRQQIRHQPASGTRSQFESSRAHQSFVVCRTGSSRS